MSLKTTLWLLAVVAILAVLLWYFQDTEQPLSTGELALVEEWPGDRIARIDVALATGESLALEPRARGWWFVDPLSDRARPEVINQLYEVLKANPRYEADSAPPLDMLKRLGLEPPRARISLFGAGDESCRIRIGERDASNHRVYVMIEGDPKLYLTGANLSNLVEKGRQEWRDDRLLDGDGTLVQRVEIHAPERAPIVFERHATHWLMTSPRVFAADSSVVNQLVNGLLLLKIDAFIKVQPEQADLDSVGLTPATETRVVLAGGPLGEVEVRFGPGAAAFDPLEGRCCIDSVRQHIFKVRGSALEPLYYGEKRFRDPGICRVTINTMRWLRARLPDGKLMEMRFRDATRGVEMVEPFERRIDDGRSGELYSWLLVLSNLRAEDFMDLEELPPAADPWSQLGFDRPRAVLEFETVDSSNVTSRFRVEFAEPDGGGTVPVRRPDQVADSAYLVAEQEAEHVISVDPRQFLLSEVFPTDQLEMKTVTIRAAGRSRVIKRDPVRGAEYWNDPTRDRDTSDFQTYVCSLSGVTALSFLPRDPVPEDGLDAPTAELEIELYSESLGKRTLTVKLGRKDPTGRTVRATADCFPPRTVFDLEARVLDEVLKLLTDE